MNPAKSNPAKKARKFREFRARRGRGLPKPQAIYTPCAGLGVKAITVARHWPMVSDSISDHSYAYVLWTVLEEDKKLRNQAIKAMEKATARWSEHTNLVFDFIDEEIDAHIIIRFAEIDGPNGTLAYNYYPPTLGGLEVPDHGDMVIDVTDWRANSWNTRYYTVTHELGHGIGLDHDKSHNTVMSPHVRKGDGKLTDRDITRAANIVKPAIVYGWKEGKRIETKARPWWMRLFGR